MENWGYWRKGKEFLWNMNQLFLTTNHIHPNFSSCGRKTEHEIVWFPLHIHSLPLPGKRPLSLGLCSLFCVRIVKRIRIFILRTAQTITPITDYRTEKPDSISYCGPIISCSMGSRRQVARWDTERGRRSSDHHFLTLEFFPHRQAALQFLTPPTLKPWVLHCFQK